MNKAIKLTVGSLFVAVASLTSINVEAQSGEPIKIGFSIPMTGGLAPNVE